MGQQVSVETFTSSRDTDGNKYWTSFDPYPFKVGSKKLVYMGILNGDGPLKGQKCVVKTIRNGGICRQEWELQTKRARIARDMANCYNKVVSHLNRKITFNCPVIAEIDTVSDCLCINDILGKPKKKWNDAEFVSIELYLRGRFEDFEYGWVPQADLLDTEAFSHFTWCRSEGSVLVSNLQGIKTACAYHFTGPGIHSEKRRFGGSDLGPDGIKGFFKLHECNQICRQWPRLGDGVDLRGWGEYIAIGQKYPTAPPLVTDFPVSPPPYVENDSSCVPYSRTDPRDIDSRPVPFSGVDRNEYDSDVCCARAMARADTYADCAQRNPVQRQRDQNVCNSVEARFQRSVHQQRSTRWRNDGSFVIDWREAFLHEGIAFDPYFRQDNPVAQNEAMGMQLMWIVKKLRYTVFTPPPEYRPFEPRGDEVVLQTVVASGAGEPEKENVQQEDDSGYLLPPPYSETYVDPRFDCVTYL